MPLVPTRRPKRLNGLAKQAKCAPKATNMTLQVSSDVQKDTFLALKTDCGERENALERKTVDMVKTLALRIQTKGSDP